MATEDLQAAAQRIGMIEPDAVALPAFADIRKSVESGDIDANEALRRMREIKPHLFTDPARLTDAQFRAQEELLRTPQARNVTPERFDGIDAARLDDAQFQEFERVLRSASAGPVSSYDRSRIEDLKHK